MKSTFRVFLTCILLQGCCIEGEGGGYGSAVDAVEGFVVDEAGVPIQSALAVGPVPSKLLGFYSDSALTDSNGYFKLPKGFPYFHLDRCQKDINHNFTTGFLFAKESYDTLVVLIGEDTSTVRTETEHLESNDWLRRSDTVITSDKYDFGKPGRLRRLPTLQMKKAK